MANDWNRLVVNFIKSAKNNKYYVSNASYTVTEVINEKKEIMTVMNVFMTLLQWMGLLRN
jgi:hypothetical protein